MRYLLLSLAVAVSGCVDQRYFAPRENLNGTGPGGFPAAVYPFEGEGVSGELRTWSHGAVGEADAQDPEVRRVELHVGFELENTGPSALELVGMRSERDDLALVRVEGETLAQPGTTARIDTWFMAPGAQSARDIREFAIRYAIVAGGREILAQATPFDPYYPPDPRHYDPWFFGSSFGMGFGFGWHCH